MAFANPLPVWAFLLIVAVSASVAWLAYRRSTASRTARLSLIALRFATLLAIVIFLMRPVVRSSGERDAVVPILVDTSRSMGIADDDGRSRIDRAREIVTRRLMPSLGPRFHVEVLGFGEELRALDPSHLAADARRSDIAQALSGIHSRYPGRPIAGIVLLSDGGDTNPSTEREIRRDLSPPIYAIGVGSSDALRDREVLSVTTADAPLDDSRVELAASAVSRGFGSSPIELRLLENGRPIEVRRVTPAADGVPIRETFQVSPRREAATVYTVQVPRDPGELVGENNSRSVLVRPPSRPRRVLLVEGAPGFEHSFLKRAWSLDSGLTVDSVVRKGRNDTGADTFYIQAASSQGGVLTSGYPQTMDALCAYDVVVFANVGAGQLSAAELEATRAFVAERGGGLLVLGAQSLQTQGLARTAVEDVLPLDLVDRGGDIVSPSAARGRNLVALTDAGVVHPVMQLGPTPDDTRKKWEAAPSLASIVPLGGPRPGASVLAVTAGPGGAPRALVAVQRYGEGRSMVFTGEAAWLWKMMRPSSDHSYETFWRQSVRWLGLAAPDPMEVGAQTGAPGDPLTVKVTVRSAAFKAERQATVDVRVTAPDGHVETIKATPSDESLEGPGRYAARVPAATPGVYQVAATASRDATSLGRASTAVLVGGADLEMSDPRLNRPLLERIARASGGRLVPEEAVASLEQALTAGIPAATVAVRRDLWHSGWSFLAIMLLLGAEWLVRRHWGLR